MAQTERPDNTELPLSQESDQVLVLAESEARRLGHNYIGTEHILLGLVPADKNEATRLLENTQAFPDKIRTAVEFIIGKRGEEAETATDVALKQTPRAEMIIKFARREAIKSNSEVVTPLHLLLGTVLEGEGIAATVLESLGMSYSKLKTEIAKSGEAEEDDKILSRLQKLSSSEVGLLNIGYRSSTQIELFGHFSTGINPEIVQSVLKGNCSMLTILNTPEIKEHLESDLEFHKSHTVLVNALLPKSATDLIGLTRLELDELENLQDSEQRQRHSDGTTQQLYLEKGGNGDFEGHLAWGLIEHNGANYQVDHEREEVTFLIRLGTVLPHVRYVCEFKASLDGHFAEVIQRLEINPRVARIVEGFDDWYQSLKS